MPTKGSGNDMYPGMYPDSGGSFAGKIARFDLETFTKIEVIEFDETSNGFDFGVYGVSKCHKSVTLID